MIGRVPLLRDWQPSSAMIRVRQMCAEAFGITDADLLGRSRKWRISHARQATAYVLRHKCALSTPKVAVVLGRFCHTTIVHGCQQVEQRMRQDPALAAQIKALLRGRAPSQQDAHVAVWAAQAVTRLDNRLPFACVPIFADEELTEFVERDRVFCGQCDRSVRIVEAVRCQARLCGLRRAA